MFSFDFQRALSDLNILAQLLLGNYAIKSWFIFPNFLTNGYVLPGKTQKHGNRFLGHRLQKGSPYAIGPLSVCLLVSDIAIFVLKMDVKLQLTN